MGNAESQPSILPTYTPAYACELEQAYQQISYCLVQASPDLSYPCTRTEAVTETLLGQSAVSQLIQRDYHFSAGFPLRFLCVLGVHRGRIGFSQQELV